MPALLIIEDDVTGGRRFENLPTLIAFQFVNPRPLRQLGNMTNPPLHLSPAPSWMLPAIVAVFADLVFCPEHRSADFTFFLQRHRPSRYEG